jgi:hypothetical protein
VNKEEDLKKCHLGLSFFKEKVAFCEKIKVTRPDVYQQNPTCRTADKELLDELNRCMSLGKRD